MAPRKHHKKKHHHKPQQQQQHQSNSSSITPESCDLEDKTTLPYIVENSSIVGRYLTASRTLLPGEILITEEPLAIGPCVSADPVCLGCYQPVKLQASQHKCTGCGWPICSSSCRGLYQKNGHSKTECAILATQKAKILKQLSTTATSVVTVKNLYELILIVRMLLMRDHELKKYSTILLMESHLEERRKNDELWQHYEHNVVRRLRQEWQLTQFTEEEIHTICGIVDVNCFEIGQNGAKARSLYPSAYLLAHDCSPNTAHTDDPLNYAIVLRTSRKIREGEALTLSYAYTLQGTLKRRDFMHDGKLFWCSCQRCSDPTELGTDCSGIICAQCKRGIVRSTDPLCQNADWNCDNCNYKLTAANILKLLNAINDDLESIDAHNIPELENFLKRYRDVLHMNHYLLLSAKYSLCQIYGRIEGYLLPRMSLEDMKRKETCCREFLQIIDILEPGLTRLRGLIMYELHAPILLIAQHLLQCNLINRQQFQTKLKEVVSLLRQSSHILKMEPIGSNEHSMGLAAADALQKMGLS